MPRYPPRSLDYANEHNDGPGFATVPKHMDSVALRPQLLVDNPGLLRECPFCFTLSFPVACLGKAQGTRRPRLFLALELLGKRDQLHLRVPYRQCPNHFRCDCAAFHLRPEPCPASPFAGGKSEDSAKIKSPRSPKEANAATEFQFHLIICAAQNPV